jgi:hypothetical protein
MSGNKVTALNYFKRRMRDSGYIVDELFRGYSENDPRSWTVIIDPGCASIFCTCYVNNSEPNDNYFEIYDGGQFIPNRFCIKTDSFEVLLTYLNKFGIINKTKAYNNGIIKIKDEETP